MKTILQHIALFTLFFSADAFAQDVTTVRANNSDISDNLDLKAVASIFGESSDLEDFERRLNDPDLMISNLDLNGDNRVDYLRVIEATENNTHLIILQAVLAQDTFQDVATIEVERDSNNNVQVQVVGDVYMYGSNYIYEPVYVSRPVMFDLFWVNSYRPYYSPWYWGYYPTYYTYWAPYPVYRYRRNVHVHINTRNNYVYTSSRGSSRAAALYSSRRQNAYERQNPGRSFSSRNNNAANRYALEQSRSTSRSEGRSSFTNSSRGSNAARANSNNINTVRENGRAVRNTDNTARSSQSVRNVDSPARSTNNAVRSTQRSETQYTAPARNVQRSEPQYSAPVRSNNAIQQSPARIQQSAPAIQQRSAPVQSAPARQSAPEMRSAPAPARQAAPAQSAPARSAGNSSRRG